MKQEISSLELHFLVKELKALERSKIDKIYQLSQDEFIFRLYTKEGKKSLRIKLPGLIYVTEQSYIAPENPMGYCTFLRKYLSKASLISINQKGFEKIILLEFSDKEYGVMTLIYEMIKPGNLILCKKDGEKLIVLNPLIRRQFKDRNVQAREEYQFPPAQPDILTLNEKDIAKLITSSDKDLVKALAIDLGLGGTYSEEILSRAGLEKSKTVSDEQAKKISSEIKNLLKEEIKPFISGHEAFPISMKTKNQETKVESFQKAIDQTIQLPKEEQKKPESKNQLKFNSIIDSQNKRFRELEKEAVENQKIGEYIYEHYADFEKLLNTVKELRKTKSLPQIKEELKKNKHFKEMNEKEKKIILEF